MREKAEGSSFGCICSVKWITLGSSPQAHTILFIPLSSGKDNCQADWAACTADLIRRCPACAADSIIGHGWRRKQAHDENHDWIWIRRGLCKLCSQTFTLLPLFSPPYGHYSLMARRQALERYCRDRCSADLAGPPLKDPDRTPDASTIRRWRHSLPSPLPHQRSPLAFFRALLETLRKRWRHRAILPPGPFRQNWFPLRS